MAMMMKLRGFAVLCAAVVCVLVLPLETAAAPVSEEVIMPARLSNSSSCLTPKQDKELRKAIAGIEITLSTTVAALDIAAAAEKDQKIKHELEEAATVISAVNKYLVANLTAIVDSACGNCSQIIRVINESAQVLEQTLSNIDPSLKNTTAWKLIVTAIDDILAIAELICPSRKFPMIHSAFLGGNSSCLNETQLALMKKIVAGIQAVLAATEISLDIAAAAESNPKTKHDLQMAATIIHAVNVEIVGNLTKILNGPCATCTDIVNIVEETVHALEDTLNKIVSTIIL